MEIKQILVVDDDEAFRLALCKTLRRAGYEVAAAENGTVALKHFQERCVDLVITDLVMPEKEGLETIIQLGQLRPDLKIIAMSGGGRVGADNYLSLARHLGATQTIAKPFAGFELLEMVERILNGNGSAAEPNQNELERRPPSQSDPWPSSVESS